MSKPNGKSIISVDLSQDLNLNIPSDMHRPRNLQKIVSHLPVDFAYVDAGSLNLAHKTSTSGELVSYLSFASVRDKDIITQVAALTYQIWHARNQKYLEFSE